MYGKYEYLLIHSNPLHADRLLLLLHHVLHYFADNLNEINSYFIMSMVSICPLIKMAVARDVCVQLRGVTFCIAIQLGAVFPVEAVKTYFEAESSALGVFPHF